MRCDGKDNTKKLWCFISIVVLYKKQKRKQNQFPPLYWFFCRPPFEIRFFSEPQSDLLKATKFSVKFFQFEFLVMTEKNIWQWQMFCNGNPPSPRQKGHPLFPIKPPLKIKVLSSIPVPF